MNNKLNLKILIAITVLIVVSLIVYVFLNPKESNNTLPAITPKPIEFNLIKSIPQNNTVSNILPTQSLEFQFTKPVDFTSTIIKSTPFKEFTLSKKNSDKTLLVRPNIPWTYNTDYQIVFNIKSATGEEIPEVIYNFKITPLTDSPLGAHGE